MNVHPVARRGDSGVLRRGKGPAPQRVYRDAWNGSRPARRCRPTARIEIFPATSFQSVASQNLGSGG